MQCGQCRAQLPMIPNLRFCPVCGAECGREALLQPDALEGEIVAMLKEGKVIEAIKRYRAATNFGLKEAKDVVDAIALKHHIVPPQSSGSRGGRILIALVFGFLMATAGLAVFPAIGQVASPFLCAGSLQVQSNTYRPVPGQTAVTRNFFCPDGREVTWRAAFVSFAVYSAAAFLLLSLVAVFKRKRD